MSILSIKQEMLLPQRESIINKKLIIRQKPAIIASVTEQEGIVKLWIFQQITDSRFANMDEGDSIQCVTNRDRIWRNNSRTHVYCDHISKITIQGLDLPIQQSSSHVAWNNPMVHMKLQHFIEAGVDFSSMENISLDQLFLSEYQMKEGFVFPEIDTGTDIPVSLTLRKVAGEVLIEPTHWFRLKKGDQNIEGSFRDPSNGKETVYYIDRVFCHDIWKETEERFRDEEALKIWRKQGLDDAAIEQAKAGILESLESICPKGHELLTLRYECQDNIQLNFYTTEFLLARPENDGKATSVALIGSSDEESRHGYQVRFSLLKTVPAGFDGNVEAELVSWFCNKPDETIEG